MHPAELVEVGMFTKERCECNEDGVCGFQLQLRRHGHMICNELESSYKKVRRGQLLVLLVQGARKLY